MTQTANAAVNVATVAYLPGSGAHMIRVRASIGGTGPALTITGVPDEPVRWTRDRLYAGTGNAGLNWPRASVRLDLVPTLLSSTDTGIDVALAVAVLAAAGQLPTEGLQDVTFIGELGLDGTLRTPSALPERLAAAANAGFAVLAPAAGLATPGTAADVAVATAWPVQHLRQLAAQVRTAARTGEGWPTPAAAVLDLGDVPDSCRFGRRVLEIAAAGGHHLALLGPARAPITMLARRLPGLLPDLDDRTGAQAADLYRGAGLIPPHVRILRRPPWQEPHHTTTVPGLFGNPRRSGPVSLAHGGLLLLDQAPEFPGGALDALRRALDTDRVVLTGGGRAVEYPAKIQLVLTASDCPSSHPDQRPCTPGQHRRHLARLRPLLDRIPIHAAIPPLPPTTDTTTGAALGEPTSTVAARVARARAAATARWATPGVTRNHDIPADTLHLSLRRCRPGDLAPLRARRDSAAVTPRAADDILRVAWTIADLAGHARPQRDDVEEALTLRTGTNPTQPD